MHMSIKKLNRIISLIRQLSIDLPQNVLLTIYKSLVWPHPDYRDILYDKPNNEIFQSKLEKVQYRTYLAITGAIQVTSRAKCFDELGLHSLIKRRWYNKLIFIYKTVNDLLPSLLIFGFSFSNKSFFKIIISLYY